MDRHSNKERAFARNRRFSAPLASKGVVYDRRWRHRLAAPTPPPPRFFPGPLSPMRDVRGVVCSLLRVTVAVYVPVTGLRG